MPCRGVPTFANHAATNGYDLTLAEGLAHELRRDGVDVLGVLPGPTLTQRTATMGMQPDKGPMRFGPPDRVVASALGSLGKRSTLVPGAVNRVMSAVVGRAMSRSRRTKVVAGMLRRMPMTGGPGSWPQAQTADLHRPGRCALMDEPFQPALAQGGTTMRLQRDTAPLRGEAGSVLVGQRPSP